MLSKAIEIANRAHAGQVDKAGLPYILHPLRVMLTRETEIERICAVMHDVVEDSKITIDDLRKEGFSEDVIMVLDCLTKRNGEKYDDFIDRILVNETACHVKLADLCDNMDTQRIKNPTEKDMTRMKKYRDAANRILDVLPLVEGLKEDRVINVASKLPRDVFIAHSGYDFWINVDDDIYDEQINELKLNPILSKINQRIGMNTRYREVELMRKNQLSMTLTRHGDQVPKGYPEERQVLHVYADSNDVFEALSKGYAEVVNLLLEYEPDHFGRCDGSTNADGSFYSRMLGKRNKLSDQRKEAIKDLEDIIFYAENAVDILTVIKDSNNVDDAREALMQKYELPAHKVNKIMRLRFAMFTKNDVNKLKERRDKYIEQGN